MVDGVQIRHKIKLGPVQDRGLDRGLDPHHQIVLNHHNVPDPDPDLDRVLVLEVDHVHVKPWL